jgi:hypothetical protein
MPQASALLRRSNQHFSATFRSLHLSKIFAHEDDVMNTSRGIILKIKQS